MGIICCRFYFFLGGLFSGSGAAGGGAIINFKNAFVAGLGSSVISYGLIRLVLVFVAARRHGSAERRASTAPPVSQRVKNAVTVSLAAPALALLGTVLCRPLFIHNQAATMVAVILSAVLAVGGLCFGIYSLVAMKRFNPKGVFGPALFGTILSGLMAFITGMGVLTMLVEKATR